MVKRRRLKRRRVAFDLRFCPLAQGVAPLGCDWCGRALTGRQSRWCGGVCESLHVKNHLWSEARVAALRRDGRKCVRCKSIKNLEVNHIIPLVASSPGKDRNLPSCDHHQSNLETLCHSCHLEATAKQRAEGLIPSRRKT